MNATKLGVEGAGGVAVWVVMLILLQLSGACIASLHVTEG
jgi:hypothetical protein